MLAVVANSNHFKWPWAAKGHQKSKQKSTLNFKKNFFRKCRADTLVKKYGDKGRDGICSRMISFPAVHKSLTHVNIPTCGVLR